MKNSSIILLLFFFAIIVESTIISIPLTLVGLLVLFVNKKDTSIFLYAWLTGVLLDIAYVRTIGLTSIFFTTFIFLVSLYDKKYEIRTLPFCIIAICTGAALLGLLYEKNNILMHAGIAAMIASIIFLITSRISPQVHR
jgi:cell shape-determining protein MreD